MIPLNLDLTSGINNGSLWKNTGKDRGYFPGN